MNRAVGLSRAVSVVLAATPVIGVARATDETSHHDCGAGGSLLLWVWLIAPLSVALAVVAFGAPSRAPTKLRRTGLAFIGAASGVLLAAVTYWVTGINVGCQDHGRSGELAGAWLAVGMVLGSALLFIGLTLVGAILLLVSHQPRTTS